MVDKAPNAPRGHQVSTGWPAWRYGPNEQAAIFQTEADVPEGWADHPSKAFTPEPKVAEATLGETHPEMFAAKVETPRRPLTLKRNG